MGDLEAVAKVVKASAGLGFTGTSRRRAKTGSSSIRRACRNGAAIGSSSTGATWSGPPEVDALQTLRGVSFVMAGGLVAEAGDTTALIIRDTSWRFSAWCRRITRVVGPAFAGAASPRRAIRTPGGCSPKRRRPIRARPGSGGRCSIDRRRC